jgi:predicted nucleic acid-binding protein
MLDTNVAIHLRDRDVEITRRVNALDDDLVISAVTRVELEAGVYRDPNSTQIRRARLDVVLATIRTVDFDDSCAVAYGKIVQVAGYSRRKLLDRMIAAQAVVHRATLVSLNADDFRDILGLSLLAW